MAGVGYDISLAGSSSASAANQSAFMVSGGAGKVNQTILISVAVAVAALVVLLIIKTR